MQAAITIGKRAFFVSFFALLTIIVFAGILSYTVPPGSYGHGRRGGSHRSGLV
jgi:uncharacterized ion transporter superfamily protein YfcC